MILYFVRHGEVHNPGKILYGRLPRFPISMEGKKKIHKLADNLQEQKISAVYSSPMLRARQTAKIIAHRINKRISISALLTEVDIIFQGMSLDEYRKSYQPYMFDEKYLHKGQESLTTIKRRINQFADMIIRRHKKGRILAVSHGDPIVIFLAAVLGTEFNWDFKRKNYLQTGSYMKFEYDSKINKWKYLG